MSDNRDDYSFPKGNIGFIVKNRKDKGWSTFFREYAFDGCAGEPSEASLLEARQQEIQKRGWAKTEKEVIFLARIFDEIARLRADDVSGHRIILEIREFIKAAQLERRARNLPFSTAYNLDNQAFRFNTRRLWGNASVQARSRLNEISANHVWKFIFKNPYVLALFSPEGSCPDSAQGLDQITLFCAFAAIICKFSLSFPDGMNIWDFRKTFCERTRQEAGRTILNILYLVDSPVTDPKAKAVLDAISADLERASQEKGPIMEDIIGKEFCALAAVALITGSWARPCSQMIALARPIAREMRRVVPRAMRLLNAYWSIDL